MKSSKSFASAFCDRDSGVSTAGMLVNSLSKLRVSPDSSFMPATKRRQWAPSEKRKRRREERGGGAYHFGLEGGLVGLVKELLKVNPRKERVAHDLLSSILSTAKTLRRISAQQSLQDCLALFTQERRIINRLVHNVVEELLHVVGGAKGGLQEVRQWVVN